MLAILFFTLAADPLPTPKLAPLPVPKFATDGVSVTESAGEWVVKLNGRTFTVSKSESKETAVRLAKEVAGEKMAAASPVATVKGHRHTCPKCSTSWEHADNDPNASHVCPNPKCRAFVTKQSGSVLIPVAPAPAKPKRVNIGGKWYDQYADGRLVECVT